MHGTNHLRDLPPGVDKLRYGPPPNVSDAKSNPIRMIGLVDLVTRLGNRIVKVEFIGCKRLAAPVILGCDFCDRFVEALFPRKRLIEMDGGTTVPITRRSLRHPYKQARTDLKEDEAEKLSLGGRVSPKLRVARNVVLSPETWTWVTVTTKRHGLAVIQHNDDLNHRESISATNGVVQVEQDKPFRVLAANFGRTPRSLAKNQVIGTLLPHPTEILPTKMSFEDVVGLVNDSEAETHGANISDVAEVEPPENKEGVDVEELDLSQVAFCNRENYALCCQNIPTFGMAPSEKLQLPNIGSICFLGHAQFRQFPIGLEQKCERRNKTKLIACYAQA